MIRPVTCICFLLACGSGLYLYETKHRVTVLDKQIEKTVRATETTREQIRLLHADWTLLNQPDRLQKLAEQFLALKTTSPAQFTSFAELDSRLPPVPPPPAIAPPATPDLSSPPLVAAAEPPPPTAASTAPRIAENSPVAHRNAAEHAPAEAAKPSSHATAALVAVAVAPRPAPPIPRPRASVIEAAARPAWAPRPVAATARSYYAAPVPQPVMSSGSLLGMAHAAAGPPPPAPTPLGRWVNDGN